MNEDSKQPKTVILVPDEILEKLLSKQEEILYLLKGGKSNPEEDEFITESDAKKIYLKGNTWFWNKRKSGELQFRKLGQTVYYKKADLLNLIRNTTD